MSNKHAIEVTVMVDGVQVAALRKWVYDLPPAGSAERDAALAESLKYTFDVLTDRVMAKDGGIRPYIDELVSASDEFVPAQ